MGLLDILTGGLSGGGQGNPRGQQQSGGGMSPIAMAILALLAGRGLGGSGGGGMPGGMPPGDAGRRGTNPGSPWDSQGQGQPSPGAGGGLGDLLGGLFGGMGGRGMPGGLGGGMLSGGLNDLVRQMDRNGHGDTARSWVGRGENRRIAPEALEQALGPDNVDSLAQQAGIDRIGLLSGLSEQLPGVIDQLTPEGRVPTDEEAEGML